MDELFKDIPGFEGLYQVSNYGNVKSVEKLIWRETNYHSGHWARFREKILTPTPDEEGYVHVRLCKQGVYTLWKIHQLVALVFLNHDRKDKKFIVHHLNHNKQDNRASNLEVIERSLHTALHRRGEL